VNWVHFVLWYLRSHLEHLTGLSLAVNVFLHLLLAQMLGAVGGPGLPSTSPDLSSNLLMTAFGSMPDILLRRGGTISGQWYLLAKKTVLHVLVILK